MMNSVFSFPKPHNEPVLEYAPHSEEREELRENLISMRQEDVEIPLIIGGKEIRTGNLGMIRIPHDHQKVIARYHKAGPKEIEKAVEAADAAWKSWSATPWEQRASIFFKVAERISRRDRFRLNASTMLCQSKTVHQAEIDAVCELADFLRFNIYNMQQMYLDQPEKADATWNFMDYRPLEGFVFAATPFNFTAIGGNLSSAPALMGNTVLWKPASTAVHSAYQVMRLFMEAGLPEGVINFVPGDSQVLGEAVLSQPTLGGVNFTGSNRAFNNIWSAIGNRIGSYRSYPRIAGETGGKDFVVAHASADIPSLATALIRGAFEYQGQKCSATSRAYIPRTLWEDLRNELANQMKDIKVGDVENFENFMGAVIDRPSFENISSCLEYAKKSDEATIVFGGACDDTKGFFVEPTVILTTNPKFRLMEEEIFGPVLTVYLYDPEKYEETLHLCDSTSPYGLTGSVFASDRTAVQKALQILRHAAGNFYVNDKTTGSMVAHQPFGGSRASGTNDKVGSSHHLMRWVSMRVIKECFDPPRHFSYPFLARQ